MWNNNDKIMSVFDMDNNGNAHFPFTCPICNKENVHIYIHNHDDKHCGIWVWCSSCHSYSHMSGELPKWWKNPDFVDADKLCSEPEYLETISDKIDIWVNNIMLNEKIFPEKSLVMENKFKVKLLVNYQDIPAGVIGTLIVKDDFRKITISFVNSKGEIINLKIQPEKVASVFEVIN